MFIVYSHAVRRGLAGCALVVAILLALGPTTRSRGAEAGPETRIVRATLDNGLRVVVVHNPLAPVVTTQVNYLVGRTRRRTASRAWRTPRST